ncbi:MAG: adenine deaminase [Methanospirillum sp.]|nr:adenine deaminase [Methanospirillum sp.]
MPGISRSSGGFTLAGWAESADIVFKNGTVFDPFTCEWLDEDFAVKDGRVIGNGHEYRGREEVDLKSAPVVPGFIDAHVHIESSLLTPHEYARLVMQSGTTTVIADPHEIANVCGTSGIEYMLRANQEIPLDLFITLPSCVPATPLDECREALTADRLRPFIGRPGVVGLGEMMNLPGVVGGDPGVLEKITLTDIRDGHAPFVSGTLLDRYIAAGLQSDHETVLLSEGREKLQKGMFLFIREGSTERNLRTLIPLVNACTSPRCCFCTDDRHADMLAGSGHIDDCIRKAVAEGCEPELAFRMATLSPSERFRLSDRGALSPGRVADFCILEDIAGCRVSRTYKNGELVSPGGFKPPSVSLPDWPFETRVPAPGEIEISGSGTARVVRIQEGQIATKAAYLEVPEGGIPDTGRDILKLVVLSRYHRGKTGIGLVQGMGLKKGAIASSVSHDSHNVIAAGTNDPDILAAIQAVVRNKGGMAICEGQNQTCLPLQVGGLMSELPYEKVNELLSALHRMAKECGAIPDPFMYLSFLALSVIPELRVTTLGVFDVNAFSPVPLFVRDTG